MVVVGAAVRRRRLFLALILDLARLLRQRRATTVLPPPLLLLLIPSLARKSSELADSAMFFVDGVADRSCSSERFLRLARGMFELSTKPTALSIVGEELEEAETPSLATKKTTK